MIYLVYFIDDLFFTEELQFVIPLLFFPTFSLVSLGFLLLDLILFLLC